MTTKLNGVTPMKNAIGGAFGAAKTLLNQIKRRIEEAAKPNKEIYA